MLSKKDIRAEMRCRSAAFRDSEKAPAAVAGAGDSSAENAAAESIWRQVEAMPEFVAALSVLIYMSIPGEVPTREFIARWYGRKQFVLPRVCQGSFKNSDQVCNSPSSGASNNRNSICSRAGKSESESYLELREYDPRWLISGYRGIEEPSADAPLVNPCDIDLALVPGVAFARRDSDVWRLGRGGGFYDRLLPLLTCPTVGICFSYRVFDALPLDPWDAPLTHLVTNI